MKIVFLNRTLGIGGAERQLALLAAGLHERGHNVVVAVFYGGYPMEQEVRVAGVPLYYLEKAGRWDNIGFPVRLIRFLAGRSPTSSTRSKARQIATAAWSSPISFPSSSGACGLQIWTSTAAAPSRV